MFVYLKTKCHIYLIVEVKDVGRKFRIGFFDGIVDHTAYIVLCLDLYFRFSWSSSAHSNTRAKAMTYGFCNLV